MAEPTPNPHVAHFPDAAVSVFQSALAGVDLRRRAGAAAAPVPVDHASPAMLAVAQAADAATPSGTPMPSGGAEPTLRRCAEAYLALALARTAGDPGRIAAAEAALPPFGICDPRWAETLQQFLLHYPFGRRGAVPYRRWEHLDDFVLPDRRDAAAVPVLPRDARVAVISDWGTGESRPRALLRAVAALKPHVVIHLGDIYYSCDAREAAAFFDDIRAVFPEGSARVFTLCGNHDMYAGGAPYYGLLDRLGQPASFFCLRNADWQFVAMDTGSTTSTRSARAPRPPGCGTARRATKAPRPIPTASSPGTPTSWPTPAGGEPC